MTHSSKTFTNFLILCYLLFYTTRSVTKHQFQCSNFILIVSHEHFYYAALARQVVTMSLSLSKGRAGGKSLEI